MNKALFFFLMLGLVVQSAAQPVFQVPSVPVSGYTSDLVAGAYFEPTEGSASAQSWDFSGTPGNAVGLLEVIPAYTSSFDKTFVGADWASVNGDQLSFGALSNGEWTLLGNANAANGVTIPFSDPLVQWSYPLEYGLAISDEFGSELTVFEQPYSLAGDASFEVDAWGSLVMPGGNLIPEVLRGVYTQFYTETYDGDTANWYLNQVVYHAADSLFPLFYHEILTVSGADGNTLLEVTDVAWLANGVTSVSPLEPAKVQAPFPNPVKSGETVTWPLVHGQRWRALGLDGKVLDEGMAKGSGIELISTSGWGTGMVLLMTLGANGEPCASCPVHRVLVH